MIHVVTAQNRSRYHHALTEMHRHRKQTFIDQMGWALEAPAGLEIDAYDAEDAVYLIDADDPEARVAASVRLLPTTRPHLLSEVFPHLCSDGAPVSPAIWEASRFCPAPQTPKGVARHRLLGRAIAGIIETGLSMGIAQVTFVASAALAPLARAAGWSVAPLGPSVRIGRDRVTAFLADIDAAALRRVQVRHALTSPVTIQTSATVQRAA